MKVINYQLFHQDQSVVEKVRVVYEFVRDYIYHSWDIRSMNITCKASEVLYANEGICYAKANLLAALLRSQGIPTGFCYQRLMLFDTPESGYVIHAFNAVFIFTLNRWVRLDARGNKAGVQAEFSIEEEKLAFSIKKDFNEVDYPYIVVELNKKTMNVLKKHTNLLDMYRNHLPDSL